MKKNLTPLFWVLIPLSLLGTAAGATIFPELKWLPYVGLGLFLVSVVFLIVENRSKLRSRSVAYGLNSVITTLLVICLIGVLNFVAFRYPKKVDLTKNKVNTVSEQTTKLLKGLDRTVKLVLFAKSQQREELRPLLGNLKDLSPKLEIEYVDPDKEATRSRQAGIKKYNTLQIQVGARESKVEDPNEEKVTNALIKLLKEKAQTVCSIAGHGEKSMIGREADGYSFVKQELEDQAYQVRDVNIIQETKIPEVCDAIFVLGPSKAFLEKEIQILGDYLANGGRALVAFDVPLKGGENAPEFNRLFEAWYLKPVLALIVDPVSQRFNGDAASPLLAEFSKEHAVTRDFKEAAMMPVARPLELLPNPPVSLNVQWLARTTPASWGVTDLKSVSQGQLQKAQQDKQGPLIAVAAVEGKLKDSKAQRNTRILAMGSSQIGTNNFVRFGSNMDFFLNSAAWVLEDESLIAIRAKEEEAGKVELSEKMGRGVFWITVVILPLLVFAAGIVVWLWRRKL